MAFAHGSNDVANAIGPLAAVISMATTGAIAAKSALPIWVLMLGGGGIVIGLATFGRHVIATVGKKITQLTPSRGFAAELAAATTIVIASGTGMPISTTHTLVGAVLGVGMARGIEAIDLRVVAQDSRVVGRHDSGWRVPRHRLLLHLQDGAALARITGRSQTERRYQSKSSCADRVVKQPAFLAPIHREILAVVLAEILRQDLAALEPVDCRVPAIAESSVSAQCARLARPWFPGHICSLVRNARPQRPLP